MQLKRELKVFLAFILVLLLVAGVQALVENGWTGPNVPRNPTEGSIDSSEGIVLASEGLSVTCQGTTPANLVDSMLGSGITYSNVNYKGTACSAGTFSGGTE